MKKQLVILNILAVAFFFACWFLLGFELSDPMMFKTADSESYLAVAEWIFGGEETFSTSTRPVLYPALLGGSYFAFGEIGVWLLHFACWLLSINLTFISTQKWSKSPIVAWISAVLILGNLSFISLTFHALTEVVTTALLSVLFYHVVSYWKRYNEVQFGVKLLLIFVLLTLVKPAFFYPTIVCLVLMLFAYRKMYLQAPKRLIYPILVIVPILLQMSIVQSHHGSFKVSKIAGITFKYYYFAQCVRTIEGINEQESKDFVEPMTSSEQMDYLLDNKGVCVKQFAENVILNMKADPDFLKKEYSKGSDVAFSYMRLYNLFGLCVNLLGGALLSVLFLRAFFKRNREVWVPLLCVGG
ncbi:MAG: hypothetical protein AB8B56_10295 [Crocinitomicaceae bacterium]